MVVVAYGFRVECWWTGAGCSILLCMPLEQAPEDRLTRTQGRKARPVRWGHLQQAVARHGVVTTRLVVYPPDASDAERLRAHRLHVFAPIAVGAGTSGWLFLIALGVSPEHSALALICLIAPLGIRLSRRARPLRSRVISLWSSRVGFRSDPEDERREEMLALYSSVMETACDDLRRGLITRETFERIWASVYADARRARSADGARTPSRR